MELGFCLGFAWCVVMFLGIVMCEYRLQKIQRMMEKRESRREAAERRIDVRA